MKQKYPNGSTVYSYYLDIETAELKCEKLIIKKYNHKDEMKWRIIDEYVCQREEHIPNFLLKIKQKRKVLIRLPGMLISDNKIVAKMKFFRFIIENFGHIERKNHYNPDSKMIDVVKYAKQEMKHLIDKYPEKYLLALDNIKTTEHYYTIWR